MGDLKKQLESYKEAARYGGLCSKIILISNVLYYFRQCKERYVRMQKERDYHRMHHRRVTQEKNKLITDIKKYVEQYFFPVMEDLLNCVYIIRMKEHFGQYEPLMQQLKHKYQVSRHLN